MSILSPEQIVTVAIALAALASIFCLAHIVRSILLKKTIGVTMVRMYATFIIVAVVAILSLTGTITGEALTALLGAIVGYALGGRQDQE